MKLRELRDRLLLQEDLNFLLTNRIPRRLATHLMGWYSRIESPLLCRLSIALWRLFTDLDLSEAREQRFGSLQQCFTRALKPGARPVVQHPDLIVSPCDAIVGACGRLDGTTVLQAKGLPYSLDELLGDAQLAGRYRNGCYVTLRLTSSMYHRFHAPDDGWIDRVSYVSGDTWNVNPIALARIERLFCRNERAVIRLRVGGGRWPILLVPVAAILVASIRLHCVDVRLHLRYRGPNDIPCRAMVSRGEELGWFEHGSTILLFAPAGFRLCESVLENGRIRMGEALMRIPGARTTTEQ